MEPILPQRICNRVLFVPNILQPLPVAPIPINRAVASLIFKNQNPLTRHHQNIYFRSLAVIRRQINIPKNLLLRHPGFD